MRQRKKRNALSLAIIMLLIPSLALAQSAEVTIADGDLDITAEGYSLNGTETAFVGEGQHTITVTCITNEKNNNIRVLDTGSAVAVVITGSVVADTTGGNPFLTLRGDVNDLTLKNVEITINAGNAPAIAVTGMDGTSSDVNIKMDNATVISNNASSQALGVSDGSTVNIQTVGENNAFIKNEAGENVVDLNEGSSLIVSDGTLMIENNNNILPVIGGTDTAGTLIVTDSGEVVMTGSGDTNIDVGVKVVGEIEQSVTDGVQRLVITPESGGSDHAAADAVATDVLSLVMDLGTPVGLPIKVKEGTACFINDAPVVAQTDQNGELMLSPGSVTAANALNAYIAETGYQGNSWLTEALNGEDASCTDTVLAVDGNFVNLFNATVSQTDGSHAVAFSQVTDASEVSAEDVEAMIAVNKRIAGVMRDPNAMAAALDGNKFTIRLDRVSAQYFWQASAPDMYYGSLNQYVPPEAPHNAKNELEELVP